MAKPPRQPARDVQIKDQIYTAIRQRVQKLLAERNADNRVSRQFAKEIFDHAVDVMFTGVLAEKDDGYFRFPLGYGIMRVRKFKPRPARSMPTRKNLPVAPIAKPETRLHVRFTEGATVKKALGTYKGEYQRQSERIPLALKRRR